MSNHTLKERISEAIRQFETEEIDLAALRSSVLANSGALEAMPYAMIKDIESIKYNITILQFYEEEGCEITPEEVLNKLKTWLKNVPE